MSDLDEIPFCPIYYPTEEEFKNFEKLLEKYEKITKAGIIKVSLIFTYFRLFLPSLSKLERIITKTLILRCLTQLSRL